jgi:uncharacterized membrane protein YeiB
MDSNMILIIAGALIAFVVIVVGIILTVSSRKKDAKNKPKSKKELAESYEKMMQDDVYHIFSKEFHEELRNKARLDFQKVISENAMFLQQDLRLTTSEINEYLKKEVSGKLEEEFAAYQQSIKDVQQAAVDSLNKTVAAAQEQQLTLLQKMKEDTEAEKVQVIAQFEANMAEIVSHYVQKTVGDQIDLKDQLPYILREMEAQKEPMRRDMWL